jgi:glycosyltransferase involved in cell wall biosynthesis
MKRVLIISPHFPPVNSADMHRVRQSLPYFREFGWEPVVIAVEEAFVESYSTDPLLLHTIPDNIEVHKVKAWKAGATRKIGLGSLSMRAYFFFQKKGDELLRRRKFDLVYFSTTAFHVMALGPRWKKKFGVPFILDIQDPWRSDFYLDKPKSERPPKFLISYTIDKYLEARTVPRADGIISVSQGYCDTFVDRYPDMKKDRCRVIPFGASTRDFEIMQQYIRQVGCVTFRKDKMNLVYVGRGGYDMGFALDILFMALLKGIESEPSLFSQVHLWFIGTSYAPPGEGRPTIRPLAQKRGVDEYVTEITDRIPYFETLFLLRQSGALVVPGSTDTSYTASKIYPYILAQKPLLALFYKDSSVLEVLHAMGYTTVIPYDHTVNPPDRYVDQCLDAFRTVLDQGSAKRPFVDLDSFERYTAKARTAEQVEFFNKTISQ